MFQATGRKTWYRLKIRTRNPLVQHDFPCWNCHNLWLRYLHFADTPQDQWVWTPTVSLLWSCYSVWPKSTTYTTVPGSKTGLFWKQGTPKTGGWCPMSRQRSYDIVHEVHVNNIYLSIYLSICLSVCLSIYPSIYLSIYLSIHLSILILSNLI